MAMAETQNMTLKYGALDDVSGQEQYAQNPMVVLGIVMKLFQIRHLYRRGSGNQVYSRAGLQHRRGVQGPSLDAVHPPARGGGHCGRSHVAHR